ncbi:hypothetical protein BDY19DRAFT_904423 [Irpex rosettiformis]|uniref:Uncharacterized protein n=1 Tax=Irpex rosettiformis TaxID=378272 RepID=A0ACB8UCZ5_9APHY|nr:hypothetical protein BDY19DRAFT_904423 [Irpex rosettiformis]
MPGNWYISVEPTQLFEMSPAVTGKCAKSEGCQVGNLGFGHFSSVFPDDLAGIWRVTLLARLAPKHAVRVGRKLSENVNAWWTKSTIGSACVLRGGKSSFTVQFEQFRSEIGSEQLLLDVYSRNVKAWARVPLMCGSAVRSETIGQRRAAIMAKVAQLEVTRKADELEHEQRMAMLLQAEDVVRAEAEKARVGVEDRDSRKEATKKQKTGRQAKEIRRHAEVTNRQGETEQQGLQAVSSKERPPSSPSSPSPSPSSPLPATRRSSTRWKEGSKGMTEGKGRGEREGEGEGKGKPKPKETEEMRKEKEKSKEKETGMEIGMERQKKKEKGKEKENENEKKKEKEKEMEKETAKVAPEKRSREDLDFDQSARRMVTRGKGETGGSWRSKVVEAERQREAEKAESLAALRRLAGNEAMSTPSTSESGLHWSDDEFRGESINHFQIASRERRALLAVGEGNQALLTAILEELRGLRQAFSQWPEKGSERKEEDVVGDAEKVAETKEDGKISGGAETD